MGGRLDAVFVLTGTDNGVANIALLFECVEQPNRQANRPCFDAGFTATAGPGTTAAAAAVWLVGRIWQGELRGSFEKCTLFILKVQPGFDGLTLPSA